MAIIKKEEIKNALREIDDIYANMRLLIAKRLKQFDPEDSDTLIYAAKAMLDAKFEPTELAQVVGTSRTTIGRWAANQTIPRSAPYRKWAVGELTRHLNQSTSDEPTGANVSQAQAPVAKAGPQTLALMELR